MQGKKRFISNLTREQISSLKNGYTTGKSPVYRRRCQCILLSNSGKTVKELAEMFSVQTRTIYQWFNIWNKEGICGLQLKKGRGAKPKLDQSDPVVVVKIKDIVENEPRSTKVMVAQINAGMNIDMSTKTLKRFLKRLN